MTGNETETIRARLNEAIGDAGEVVLERHDHRPDGTLDHYVFALADNPKVWTSLTITAEDTKATSRAQVLERRIDAATFLLKSRLGMV